MCPFLSKQARVVSFTFPGCLEQEDVLVCLLPSFDSTEMNAGCLLLDQAQETQPRFTVPRPICVCATWGRNLRLSQHIPQKRTLRNCFLK